MIARSAHLLLLCALLALRSVGARAEFYRWTDAQGQARISNVAPRGVLPDGSIAPDYHPGSIAAQRTGLRARLRQRDQELARAAAQEAANQSTPVAPDSGPARQQ